MNTENIQSQMRKGVLEYCILLIINEQPAYVSDIIEKLKVSNLIVVEGTLYPLLTRLKNTQVLSYRWKESPQGPPRKYYEITPQGEELLQVMEQTWNDLNNVINNLHTTQL